MTNRLEILQKEARDKFWLAYEEQKANEALDAIVTRVYTAAIEDAKVENPCWEWQGHINPRGYGVRSWNIGGKKVNKFAHRLIYEATVGNIPEGLVIDHLCRNHACVNPTHLEVVSNRENILRGIGATAENARKTLCKNGHKFEGKNIVPCANGGRDCRICKIARDKAGKAGKAKRKLNSTALIPNVEKEV